MTDVGQPNEADEPLRRFRSPVQSQATAKRPAELLAERNWGVAAQGGITGLGMALARMDSLHCTPFGDSPSTGLSRALEVGSRKSEVKAYPRSGRVAHQVQIGAVSRT